MGRDSSLSCVRRTQHQHLNMRRRLGLLRCAAHSHTHAQLQLTSLNLLCPLYALALHTQHAHNVELTYLEPGYGALGSLPAFRDLPVRIV